jgi:hypothetical protein
MDPGSRRTAVVMRTVDTMTARKAQARQGICRRRALGAIILGGTGLLVTACGGPQSGRAPGPAVPAANEGSDLSARFAAFEVADEPNGDLTKVVWPEWLEQFDPEVKRLYEFQILNGPLMRYMPCFCGCGQTAEHRSNRDCYVKAVNPDGSVVFDSMAPT